MNLFQSLYQPAVILMVTYSDAHILLAGWESGFLTAVTGQDIMLLQHPYHDLTGTIGRQYLTEEIIRLGRHHTEEGDGAEPVARNTRVLPRI